MTRTGIGYDFHSILKCSIACAYLRLCQTHANLVRPIAIDTSTSMAGPFFSADLPNLALDLSLF